MEKTLEKRGKLLEKAEKEIQRILLDLSEAVGLGIEAVHIDTRNFENYRTEIFLG